MPSRVTYLLGLFHELDWVPRHPNRDLFKVLSMTKILMYEHLISKRGSQSIPGKTPLHNSDVFFAPLGSLENMDCKLSQLRGMTIVA